MIVSKEERKKEKFFFPLESEVRVGWNMFTSTYSASPCILEITRKYKRHSK